MQSMVFSKYEEQKVKKTSVCGVCLLLRRLKGGLCKQESAGRAKQKIEQASAADVYSG